MAKDQSENIIVGIVLSIIYIIFIISLIMTLVIKNRHKNYAKLESYKNWFATLIVTGVLAVLAIPGAIRNILDTSKK